jgi:hypothetical protein
MPRMTGRLSYTRLFPFLIQALKTHLVGETASKSGRLPLNMSVLCVVVGNMVI